MKIDVLLINSYGGSLVQAASDAGLKIRGSYENTGYGIEIQQANFPNLHYVSHVNGWPTTEDLRHTVVLAHPPCKIFSLQAGRAARGTAGEAFNDTKLVLLHAMRNKAAALAIESVPRALEGAQQVHEAFAQEFGYHLYRVLQNAATFGLAQWRPRFWAIFIRQDLGNALHFFHRRRFKSVGQVMEETEDIELGELDPTLMNHMIEQRNLLRSRGIPHRVIDEIFNGEDYGYLCAVLKRKLSLKESLMEVSRAWCYHGRYLCSGMRILDPAGLATTLMYDSWWFCRGAGSEGRILTIPEFKVVMGFPRDYVFPGRYRYKYREYLSRGVCPPVARWILETIVANISAKEPRGTRRMILKPGEVADLTLKKEEVAHG